MKHQIISPTSCLAILLLLLSGLRCVAVPVYLLEGEWLPATRNDATTAVLDQALQRFPGELPQLATTQPRICFQEIQSITQLIVNGINFRYKVLGCVSEGKSSVDGSVASGRCSCEQPQPYEVTVFCQPWTDTTQVINIASVAPVQ